MRFKCLKNQGEIKRNTFSVIAIFQKVVCSLIFRPSIRLHCVTYKFSRPIFSTISIWRSPLRWHCETRPSLYVNFAPIRGGSRTDLNQKGRYHHLFSPSKTYLVEQGRLMLPETHNNYYIHENFFPQPRGSLLARTSSVFFQSVQL